MTYLSAAPVERRVRLIGNSRKIRSRSSFLMLGQPAISSIDRLHPAHRPVAGSIAHTLMQGDFMHEDLDKSVKR
jgi:hypothetical protein